MDKAFLLLFVHKKKNLHLLSYKIEKARIFFFEKKKQKTFGNWAR